MVAFMHTDEHGPREAAFCSPARSRLFTYPPGLSMMDYILPMHRQESQFR